MRERRASMLRLYVRKYGSTEVQRSALQHRASCSPSSDEAEGPRPDIGLILGISKRRQKSPDAVHLTVLHNSTQLTEYSNLAGASTSQPCQLPTPAVWQRQTAMQTAALVSDRRPLLVETRRRRR